MNPAAFNYSTLAERCGLRTPAMIESAVKRHELACRKPSRKVVIIPLQDAYEWAMKNLQIDITKTTVEPLKKR